MVRPSFRARWRPGLRAVVLSVSGVLIVVAAILVSNNVSDHLQTTAVAEAVRTTEAVVRGYVDPLVTSEVLADPTSAAGVATRRRPRAAGRRPARSCGSRSGREDGTVVVLRPPGASWPSVPGRRRPDRRLRRRRCPPSSRTGPTRRTSSSTASPTGSCRSTCRSARPTGARSSARTRSTRTRRRSWPTSRRPAQDVLLIVGAHGARAPARCSTPPSRSRRAG